MKPESRRPSCSHCPRSFAALAAFSSDLCVFTPEQPAASSIKATQPAIPPPYTVKAGTFSDAGTDAPANPPGLKNCQYLRMRINNPAPGGERMSVIIPRRQAAARKMSAAELDTDYRVKMNKQSAEHEEYPAMRPVGAAWPGISARAFIKCPGAFSYGINGSGVNLNAGRYV